MLILCSNGLTSDVLLQAVREKAKHSLSAALVVTADHEYKEQNYHVNRCRKELESIGLDVDLFDIDYSPAEKLLEYAVVEFIGGNPFYLLKSITDHNAAYVLKQLADEKILIGWSAAAFVFGPTLELVNRYSPEMNIWKLKDLNGISLTEAEVLPHYSKFLSRFEKFEEKCKEYEHLYGVNVIRLNDGEGVIIEPGDVSVYRV